MSRVPSLTQGLQLALAFLNTHDLLEDPPDLLNIGRLQRMGTRLGCTPLIESLSEADLPELRRLRGQLYRVFAGETPQEKVSALNNVLATLAAHASIEASGSESPGSAAYRVAITGPADTDPVRAFGLSIGDAIAHALVAGGPDRLGVCAGTPCRCVFVDRTRAVRQRYCCELCNDRVAAAAYRARATG